MRQTFQLPHLLIDEASNNGNNAGPFIGIVVGLTVLYAVFCAFFIFINRKSKNAKVLSALEKTRNIVTPVFILACIGCATYLNEDVLSDIISSAVTSSVRGSLGILASYWKVLFDGTLLSTISFVGSMLIVLLYFFVTFYSQLNSVFVIFINKRRRTASIFKDTSMNVTGKLNENVKMVVRKDQFEKASVATKLKAMSEIYIKKRLSILVEDSKDRDKPFVEGNSISQEKLELTNRFTFIAGEPGVGKSMFFINYLSNYVLGKNDNLVIYYDLAQYSADVKNLGCDDNDLLIVLNSYLYRLYLNKEYKEKNDRFLKRIIKSSKNVTIILDSIDECHMNAVDSYIHDALSNIENVKVMIGTRYAYLLKMSSASLFKEKSKDFSFFLINGYNPKEWEEYVDTVIDKSDAKNKELVKQMVREDIGVMFYSEYLNPFMLRAITQTRLGGDTGKKDSPYTIISNMIEKIEDAKKDKLHLNSVCTFDIVGALSNLKSNDIERYTALFRKSLGLSPDDYKEDLKALRERLYTSSSLEKPNFSSGVLSDFYAAHCLFDVLDKTKGVQPEPELKKFVYDALIGDLFEDHYDNIIQFLMLIADQEKHIATFDTILELLKENIDSLAVMEKERINRFIFAAFESIYKFTAPRIKKDSKPLEDKIFIRDKELAEKLYVFYFEALRNNLIESNPEIYYDDVYRLITVYGYHEEALAAGSVIAPLNPEYAYKVVSLVRDSYESCFFGKNDHLFTVKIDQLKGILKNAFEEGIIDENDAKTTLIRCLLNLEFLSRLTDNEICSSEISRIKKKAIALLKEKLNGKKLPHYFPYIFDLSRSYREFDYEDNEVVFSDRDLSFDRSSSFVVLDVDVSRSFEASDNLSSLFITNSGKGARRIVSEIYGVRNSSLTTLMVSRSVKEIGEYQFDHCEKLRYVHLFDGLEEIGPFAFIHCTHITELRVPNTVSTLGESFIEDAYSLKSIQLPEEFSIGNYPFEECCSLETISGGTCKNIPDGMFRGCSNLIDFNLEMFDDIKQISDVAFAYCGRRDVIDLSGFNRLEMVGNLAFSGNEIKEIVFPKSLKELRMVVFFESTIDRIVFTGVEPIVISPYTFSGMKNVNTTIVYKGNEYSVEAFKKICKINEDDFASNQMFGSLSDKRFELMFSKNTENKELTDLNLDDLFEGVVDYEHLDFRIGCFGNHEYIQRVLAAGDKFSSLSRYMFEDSVSLTDLDLGKSSIKEINEGCFNGCLLLKRVILSDKTTKIDKQAFYLCSKVKTFSCGEEKGQENVMILPASLEEIGDNAFWGLENIEKVVLRSHKAKVKAHAFSNMKMLKTVELPDGYDIGLFENEVFDGNQNVDIYIGEERYTNELQTVRIGSSSSKTLKQGLYPNSLINKKGDPEERRLYKELEDYFEDLKKDNKKFEKELDYNDGKGSDARYWDIDYVDTIHGNKFSGKYRRLSFKKYRPLEYGKPIDNNSSEEGSYQEQNRYETGEVYWFKFEPIAWINIGQNSKGEQLYLSQFIIDSMEFNKGFKKGANQYSKSTVKEWVDNELTKFVDMNRLEGGILKEGQSFKLAYLTEEECNKLNGNFTILKAKATDYASSQGTYSYIGGWAAYFIDWPDANNEDCELYIKPDGSLYKGSVDEDNVDNFVTRTDGGVRPVLIVGN